MTAVSGIPVMVGEQKRMQFEDGVFRDAVAQPLYSTVGLNTGAAIPAELRFFNYARGQLVPGAGGFAGVASTLWHTNMDTAGQLAKPQKFRCVGVSLHLVALAAAGNAPALSDPGFSTAAVSNGDLIDDLLILQFSCCLRLRIGTKLYIDHPLWFVPTQVGFGGVAAVALGNSTVGANPTQEDVCLVTSKGIGMDFTAYPFLLEEQQAIEAVLTCPWTSPNLADSRAITMIMHGLHYREVA